MTRSCTSTWRGRRRVLEAAAILTIAAVVPGLSSANIVDEFLEGLKVDAYDAYFRAVKVDNALGVRNLLARGFDPNTIEPERGDTGLILALREDSMKVFRTLLAAPEIDIDARAFNGDSALMIAAFKGNKEAVEILLAHGASVHHAGWTPLHYAATGGHDEIAKLLLEQGAQRDARSPNNTTPMMMAAWGGHIYTVKLLLDAGADATLKNDHGMNAIDFALRSGHQDIADGLTWRLKRAGKL
jgi:ankyrin repeat protein